MIYVKKEENLMGQGMGGSLMWLVAFLAITYFLIIRPQQKQKKQREQLLNSLEKGDKVVTIGGFHGKIVAFKGDNIVLELAPQIRIKANRSAVGYVVVDEDDEKKSNKKKKKDKNEEQDNDVDATEQEVTLQENDTEDVEK